MSSYTFWPTIDDHLIFANYTERSLSGAVAEIPLLVGHNDNEAGLFKISYLLAGSVIPGSYWESLNAINGSCSTSERANASIQNGVPTWRYRWFGDFPNLRLTENPDSGAWHGEEITLIWDTEPVTEGFPETAAEKEIAVYTRGAWIAFAKDPRKGLEK